MQAWLKRFCVVAFGVVAFCAAPTGLFADGLVIVGSWNIEHLGARAYGQHPAALAQHIQLSGVDVLALQEIHDTDDNAEAITNAKLDETFDRLRQQNGQSWRYVLFPERGGVTRNQHIGVAWNADRLTLVGEPFRIPVEYANDESWKRTPYAVKFKMEDGKTDFVLIALHMKSNFEVEGLPAPTELRRLEAVALVAQLTDVKKKFKDEDIILLGDTNCLGSDEPALKSYAAAGWRDLNAGNATTYRKGRYSSPFDRILVPQQTEFKYSLQYIETPPDWKVHLGRFSDHWLVKMAIRIQDDDD